MWLKFDGIQNVRDLGGLPASDGRHVKPGRLLRGAGLAHATDADIARLQAIPLRQIVDFRDGTECARHPDRPVTGALYHSLPALPALPGQAARNGGVPDFAPLFLRIYGELASTKESHFAYFEFFRILLACPEGAVYFHCTQGKDRTGVGALLALTALGVPQEVIAEDYFLSNEGLKEAMEHPESPGSENWPQETKEALFFVFQRNLDAYLDRLTADWGGIEGYLRGRMRLTDADFDRLRDYYLE